MKICIDLTSLSYHLSGIERYALCMTDKMIDRDKKNEYILVFRDEVFEVFKDRIDGNRIKASVIRGKRKLFFLQIVLYRELKRVKADKYLFFAFPSPFLFRGKGIINTIHDMGAWDSADEMKYLSKVYFRISYRRAAKVSERILTVSYFSKKRICEILHIPEDKVIVVYSAVYDGMIKGLFDSEESIRKEYGLTNKYILTLSTLEPRKNLKLLLDAYNEIADRVDYDLVLVGRKGWKIDNVLAAYGKKDRIHITGFVKDNHLAAVYKSALCFVFPSLYEGFGLPPVEALALGTPVISSDAASLPEILMDQAKYFKSDSKSELEELLVNLNETVEVMPHELNEWQKKQYTFNSSSDKVIQLLGE